jgi:hypothetical protein
VLSATIYSWGYWSHIKRGLGNLAACGTDQLAAIVPTGLNLQSG